MQVNELLIHWKLDEEVVEALNTNKLIVDHPNWRSIIGRLYEMEVVQNNKLVKCAGKAHYRPKRFISLHPALFDKYDYVSNDRRDTFLHEIAHQIANMAKGERGHKYYWAYCMVHFGLEPNVYYNPRIYNYGGYKERKVERTGNLLEQHGFNLKGTGK